MSTYTANQPILFPCLYMMARYAECQHLVLMSEAQYTKDGYMSRVPIYTKDGLYMLTVPLKDSKYRPLNEILVHEPHKWAYKLMMLLKHVYGKERGFAEHHLSLFAMLTMLGETKNLTIAQVNRTTMEWCLAKVGNPIQVYESVDLLGMRPNDASAWLAMMGGKLGASEYLAGGTAVTNYLKPEAFTTYGIKVRKQEWTMPRGYVAKNVQYIDHGSVSVLDPLLMWGTETTLKLLGDQ